MRIKLRQKDERLSKFFRGYCNGNLDEERTSAKDSIEVALGMNAAVRLAKVNPTHLTKAFSSQKESKGDRKSDAQAIFVIHKIVERQI